MNKIIDGIVMKMTHQEELAWSEEQKIDHCLENITFQEQLGALKKDQEDQWLAMAEMTFGGGETV